MSSFPHFPYTLTPANVEDILRTAKAMDLNLRVVDPFTSTVVVSIKSMLKCHHDYLLTDPDPDLNEGAITGTEKLLDGIIPQLRWRNTVKDRTSLFFTASYAPLLLKTKGGYEARYAGTMFPGKHLFNVTGFHGTDTRNLIYSDLGITCEVPFSVADKFELVLDFISGMSLAKAGP